MSGPINSALSAMVGRANFPQMHHPHALVAHYDLATVLRALQRRGDMTYPGQLTGATVVRIAIDSPGGLATLRLLNAAGSDELNRTADQIVRQTAPLSPFPAELEKADVASQADHQQPLRWHQGPRAGIGSGRASRRCT